MTSSTLAHSFKRFAQCVVVGFALAGVAACGGGGGGGMTKPESEPEPATPDPALSAGEELATAMADGNLPLPSGHGIPSGRIEIPAGAYRDRNGFRFSCTGAEACVVAVDADGGRATVDAGAVRLARLPAAAPPPVAMPEPKPAPAEPEPEPAPAEPEPAPAPAEPEPEPAPAEPEPEPAAPAAAQIQLPVGHVMEEGATGRIEAGETRNRYNVRFTCAAGGEDCSFAYEAGGLVRATGGTLTAAAPPWPPYLVMDAARLASVLGGSALEWGSGQALSEVRTRLLTHGNIGDLFSRFGPALAAPGERLEGRIYPRAGGNRWTEDSTSVTYDEDGNLTEANLLQDSFIGESHHGHLWFGSNGGIGPNHRAYRWHRAEAVGTDEHGISYVQAVMKRTPYPDPADDDDGYPETTAVLGGLLDYADFWVTEATNAVLSRFQGPKHGAFYRLIDPNLDERGNRLEDPIRATWRGSLIGIGHNKAYPDLYREPIAGDVTITTDFTAQERVCLLCPNVGEPNRVTVGVEFSDIQKVNTGGAVTLSTQDWQMEVSGLSAPQAWPEFGTHFDLYLPYWPLRGETVENASDIMHLDFGGPDYSTAAGVFVTRQALGAFGAKKQEE